MRLCLRFEILKSNHTTNENEHLWHLKEGIILKQSHFTDDVYIGGLAHAKQKLLYYTRGVQSGFPSPYDSIPSLQLPLQVMKIVTNSQEPIQAWRHVSCPFCLILTAERGRYTPRGSAACPRHMIGKGTAMTPIRFI